jgi:hypothetical protein
MDVASIAAAAAGLIAYKAGESASAEAGKSAWRGMGRLFELMRAQLFHQPDAMATIEKLQTDPHDQTKLQEAAETLQRVAEMDDAFAETLEALVLDAQKNEAVGHVVNQAFGQAQVRKIVTFRDVHGDVTF